MATLKIGDKVILRHVKPNDGWLLGEGVLSEDCWLTKSVTKFEDTLWEVTVQNQYNALNQFEEKIINHHDKDPNDEHLNQIALAALNEHRLNQKLMNVKIGKSVAFGDVIQLRHVKSGK